MAEEGTLGLARAHDRNEIEYSAGNEPSKEELQRRMEEARDSISQTVTEIRDTVVHQYESVKDTISETLDWREQFKKQPVAWSLGAVGAGFFAGYVIAAVVKGPSNGYDRYEEHYDYQPPPARAYAAQPVVGSSASSAQGGKVEEEASGPGFLERIQETQAFDRLRSEASTIGNRFISEVSQTAQQVLLPAAVGMIRAWLEGLIPQKSQSSRPQVESSRAASGSTQASSGSSYQPVLERNQ